MFLTRALSIRTPGRGQTMSFWNQVLKLWSPPEPIPTFQGTKPCKKQ